jgi:hypothetical protein
MPRRRPALSPTSAAAVALDRAFRLCAAHMQGGFSKATDSGGAIAEMNRRPNAGGPIRDRVETCDR